LGRYQLPVFVKLADLRIGAEVGGPKRVKATLLERDSEKLHPLRVAIEHFLAGAVDPYHLAIGATLTPGGDTS
jgi:hypothetical protein